METKLYEKNCITIDGKLDEPVWESVQAHSGFKALKCKGGTPAAADAVFRIIPCEDRIYFGIKCIEPDIDKVVESHPRRGKWGTDSIELFLAPTGDAFDFYQFLVTMGGYTSTQFHSEGGTIHPDPYAPQWNYATYVGEDYWSAEIELPLSAFYMTPNAAWSDKWMMNVCRTRSEYYKDGGKLMFYTWGDLVNGFIEPANFSAMEGFPVRAAEDDIRISSASVTINNKTDAGFVGMMTVKTTNAVDGEFVFSSEFAEEKDVTLKAGENEICVPCCFAEDGRCRVDLQLTRKSDGMVFKRWYPVTVSYEPIKLELTLPEFRGNFYPGQDYSKVVGKVIANNPVTLTLEGPAISTKTVTPDADGNFVIETSDFDYGEAMLTITDSVNTVTKKLRRLAPTGHTMSWISGGNLIVDGKPVLRRNMYAPGYHGGEAFAKKYNADNLHMTKGVRGSRGFITPGRLMKGADRPGGEATKDQMPSEEMFRRFKAVLDDNKDRDFVYYYLDDEPECRGVSPVYLKHLYDYITDIDPYHVILIGTRSAGSFVEAADWFETHPYLTITVRDGVRSYGRPVNMMGKFVDEVLETSRTDKCVGFLPTCFAYKSKSFFADYPTFDELVCHTWAAVLAGAKTLWPYAYHDMNDRAALYEGIRYVFSTFEALEEMILLADRKELVRNKEAHAVYYEMNGDKMFVLANMTEKPLSVTLDEISGTWYNFRHGGMITGNSFELEPFEVVVGTSKVMDAGLPTYQETVALVDKLEYERTHSGNLLFDRHRDIKITATVRPSAHKLFDGVMDNYAWECSKEEKFMELDLTVVKPTFTKVVVGGFQIDDMQIKVRNGEELSVPAIKEKITEEFSTTFILSEPISPEALRLEFGERKVELYEIGVF